MQEQRLQDLIVRFEAAGIDVGALPAVRDELLAVEAPDTALGKLGRAVKETAQRQWRALTGELRQSQRVFGLLQQKLEGDRELTPDEQTEVKEQLYDMLRAAPAGVIAIAIEAIPIPGTSVFTPWVLQRLGLMPSHWREAHVLDELRKEAARLREAHQETAARELEDLAVAITREADEREALAHRANLHTHWDFDRDGQWDPDEVAAYEAAVDTLAGLARERGSERRWWMSYFHQVMGPVRFTEIQRADPEHPLLVCFDGEPGWVSLDDLDFALAKLPSEGDLPGPARS